MADRTNTDMLKNSGIFERNDAKQTTWSEITTRRTHEIRLQRVSRTIPPLEAHRSPSTVGGMSHSSSAVLLQHNTILYSENRRKFTTSEYRYTNESHCNGVCWLQQA